MLDVCEHSQIVSEYSPEVLRHSRYITHYDVIHCRGFSSSKHAERASLGSDIPESLLKDVEGDLLFEQDRERVWPITSHMETDVCEMSSSLIEDDFDYLEGKSKIIHQVGCYCLQLFRTAPIGACMYLCIEYTPILLY